MYQIGRWYEGRLHVVYRGTSDGVMDLKREKWETIVLDGRK